MSVLITGSAGFIGSALCLRLLIVDTKLLGSIIAITTTINN